MPSNIIDFLYKNWNTLITAPLAFIIFFILALGISFAALRWRYETIVQKLKEQINTINGRLIMKDELIDEYRQRLHIIPNIGTKFSRMSNKELKSISLSLVNEIRQYLENYHKKFSIETYAKPMVLSKAISDDDRDRIWHQQVEQMFSRHFELISKYDEKYRVDAILLRDEILSRLPEGSKIDQAYFMYEHPINYLVMGMVVDDLERLAKSLTESTNDSTFGGVNN